LERARLRHIGPVGDGDVRGQKQRGRFTRKALSAGSLTTVPAFWQHA
jgi:hypothetical protein